LSHAPGTITWRNTAPHTQRVPLAALEMLALKWAREAPVAPERDQLLAHLNDIKKQLRDLAQVQAELVRRESQTRRAILDSLPAEFRERQRVFWEQVDEDAMVRMSTRRRREDKLRRATGAFTSGQFHRLVLHFHGLCVACLNPGSPLDPIVPDHVQSVFEGGSDSIENIQPMHRTCNSVKGSKWIDYRPEAEAYIARIAQASA
jgi:5-methylcytosine-specific restriction endonuclease McrA